MKKKKKKKLISKHDESSCRLSSLLEIVCDHLLTVTFYLLAGMVAWLSYQTQMTNQQKVAYSLSAKEGAFRRSKYVDRNPGSFKCPKCGKNYRWLRNMRNHLRIECGKDPTKCCPYCPHRTKYKSSLQKHIFRIHCR